MWGLDGTHMQAKALQAQLPCCRHGILASVYLELLENKYLWGNPWKQGGL